MKLSAACLIAVLQIGDAAPSTSLRGKVRGLLSGTFYLTEYSPSGYCTDVGTPLPGSRTMYNTFTDCCLGEFQPGPALDACFSTMANPPTAAPTDAPTAAGTLTVWYPDYDNTAWADGKCINDGPLPSGRASYATHAECCEKAYGGQVSRACVSDFQLPPTIAPTGAPTEAGTLSVYYPVWNEGGFCSNEPPAVHGLGTIAGRQTYPTIAECCSTEFVGQTDGTCYSKMLSPPTGAPTTSPTEQGSLSVFYPLYNDGICTNDPPSAHGYSTLSGIAQFPTMADCCTNLFSHQDDNKCFNAMATPPTAAPTGAPTEAGTLTVYYPVREGEGYCTNAPPSSLGLTGIYEEAFPTIAECCEKHFNHQTTGYCYSKMANPPTAAPTPVETEAGSLTIFYPLYNDGICTNDPPSMHGYNSLDGIATFATESDCCTSLFGHQQDHKCFNAMATPPTASPTATVTEQGSLAIYYPLYTLGICTNDPPSVHGYNSLDGIATFLTIYDCCTKAFQWQTNGHCYSAMASPPTGAPTVAPTEAGSLTVYYAVYNEGEGYCTNDPPSAHNYIQPPSETYPTMAECCTNLFGWQQSGFCYSKMADPPTTAPTDTPTEQGTLLVYYPVRTQGEGFCSNQPPSTYGLSGVWEESFSTMGECCDKHFKDQASGNCYAQMLSPPTMAPTDPPTEPASVNVWYPDYSTAWASATCINTTPLPLHASVTYATQAECCAKAYAGQSSQACNIDAGVAV